MMENYELRKGVVLAEIYDDYYLAATRKSGIRAGTLRSINSTGAYIWRLLEKHLTSEEIVRRIAEDYEVPEEQAQEAFDAFFTSLCEAGYVIIKEKR